MNVPLVALPALRCCFLAIANRMTSIVLKTVEVPVQRPFFAINVTNLPRRRRADERSRSRSLLKAQTAVTFAQIRTGSRWQFPSGQLASLTLPHVAHVRRWDSEWLTVTAVSFGGKVVAVTICAVLAKSSLPGKRWPQLGKQALDQTRRKEPKNE